MVISLCSSWMERKVMSWKWTGNNSNVRLTIYPIHFRWCFVLWNKLVWYRPIKYRSENCLDTKYSREMKQNWKNYTTKRGIIQKYVRHLLQKHWTIFVRENVFAFFAVERRLTDLMGKWAPEWIYHHFEYIECLILQSLSAHMHLIKWRV